MPFKKAVVGVLILLIFAFACKSTQVKRIYTQDILKYFHNAPLNNKLVSVHRGGGEEIGYPENCLPSFKHIAAQMPCIIECDVRLTKDSVLVLMHDSTLNRTSTGEGFLRLKTYSELKSLKLKDNFGNITKYAIPTLSEAIKWGKERVIFTLDVKKNVPFELVMKEVLRLNALNSCVIITYNANEALEVYQINDDFLISVSIMQEADYHRLNNLGIPDKNMLAFIGTRSPKAELINFLHDRNINTILGVLGNLDKKAASDGNKTYYDLAKQGVDIFATDRPLEVNKVLQDINVRF